MQADGKVDQKQKEKAIGKVDCEAISGLAAFKHV